MCRFAARECAPAFLWVAPKEKPPRPVEKKGAESKLGPRWAKFGQDEGRASRSLRYLQVFCRVRRTGYEFGAAPPQFGSVGACRGGRWKAFTTGPAAATRALQASGSDISRWSLRFLPDQAIPIRVAESRKFRGPHENPAERFSWGEDEHRNERAFGVSRKREIWRLRGPRPTLYSASTTQVSCWGPRILSK